MAPPQDAEIDSAVKFGIFADRKKTIQMKFGTQVYIGGSAFVCEISPWSVKGKGVGTEASQISKIIRICVVVHGYVW